MTTPLTHYLVNQENLTFLKTNPLSKQLENNVDLLYLDPPYNTQNSIQGTGFTYDDKVTSTEWEQFITERLTESKKLLKTSGIIAISIDDNEQHTLRTILDTVYGKQNFIAQLIVDGGNPKNNANFFSISHEYLIVYANNRNHLLKTKTKWRKKRDGIDILLKEYEKLKKSTNNNHPEITAILKKWVKTQPLSKRLKVFYNSDNKGLYTYADLSTPGKGKTYNVLHPTTGKPCKLPSRGWGITEEQMNQLIKDNMIIFGKDETFQPLKKLYLQNKKDQVWNGILNYPSRTSTHLLEKLLGKRNTFVHPKNLNLMKDFIEYTTPSNAVIVDLFAGSGTTGHAVLELNKQNPESERIFTLVTTNENNIFEEVTKPRLQKIVNKTVNNKLIIKQFM